MLTHRVLSAHTRRHNQTHWHAHTHSYTHPHRDSQQVRHSLGEFTPLESHGLTPPEPCPKTRKQTLPNKLQTHGKDRMEVSTLWTRSNCGVCRHKPSRRCVLHAMTGAFYGSGGRRRLVATVSLFAWRWKCSFLDSVLPGREASSPWKPFIGFRAQEPRHYYPWKATMFLPQEMSASGACAL